MSELVGLIVNPSKKGKETTSQKKGHRKRRRRRRVRRNPSTRRITASTRGRGKTTIVLANPARDTTALLQLAAGTAAGLAGGKILNNVIFNHAPQVAALTQATGVEVGDVAVLTAGLFMLKKNTKHKEFCTGLVAGAGAKIALNLLDKFVFKGSGTVSLHGEDEEVDYYVDDNGNVYPVNEEENGEEVSGVPVDELSREPAFIDSLS